VNPYFDPHIMPDMSTRRPFFERVPDSRPSRPLFRNNCGVIEQFGVEFFDGEKWGFAGIPESKEAALALCRCAADSWLRTLGYHPIISGPCAHDAEVICGIFTAGDHGLVIEKQFTHRGEDEDEARNATLHAVADARGIQP